MAQLLQILHGFMPLVVEEEKSRENFKSLENESLVANSGNG